MIYETDGYTPPKVASLCMCSLFTAGLGLTIDHSSDPVLLGRSASNRVHYHFESPDLFPVLQPYHSSSALFASLGATYDWLPDRTARRARSDIAGT